MYKYNLPLCVGTYNCNRVHNYIPKIARHGVEGSVPSNPSGRATTKMERFRASFFQTSAPTHAERKREKETGKTKKK